MPAQGYEDWDLWITMVERGFQGLIIPEVLFHYRRRQGSMSTICCNEPVHGSLIDFLIEKHRASYEAHAGDVLLRKQAQVGELLRSNHELERHITTWLTPQIESRRLELERLQQKLRRAETRRALDERAAAEIGDLRDALARERQTIDALALELARTRAEVDALHASKSWKLTAPLRAAQTLLTRLTP
jgi:hypothetical protein